MNQLYWLVSYKFYFDNFKFNYYSVKVITYLVITLIKLKFNLVNLTLYMMIIKIMVVRNSCHKKGSFYEFVMTI